MAQRTIDFNTVRKLVRDLGEVSEAMTRGGPSIRTGGKLLTWIPPHKSVEPGSLAVRIDPDRRAELIAAAPDVYYLTITI